NMVLKPLPIQLPVNATSGPRGAGVTVAGAIRSWLTSRTEKLTGKENAVESTLLSDLARLRLDKLLNQVGKLICSQKWTDDCYMHEVMPPKKSGQILNVAALTLHNPIGPRISFVYL